MSAVSCAESHGKPKSYPTYKKRALNNNLESNRRICSHGKANVVLFPVQGLKQVHLVRLWGRFARKKNKKRFSQLKCQSPDYKDQRLKVRDRLRYGDRHVLDRLGHRRQSAFNRLSETYSPSTTKSRPSRKKSKDHPRGRSLPQRQDASNEDCPEDRERFRNVGESYDDSYSHSYHDRDRSRHIKRRRDNESSLSSVSKSDSMITSSVVPKEVGASLENFKVALHLDFPDQEVAIKGTLSTKRRTELCSLLKENLDIFAWQPSDMTGVPRSVAEHQLNIQEGYSLFGKRKWVRPRNALRPYKQRLWGRFPRKKNKRRFSQLKCQSPDYKDQRLKVRDRLRYGDRHVLDRLGHRRQSAFNRLSETYSPSTTKSRPSRKKSNDHPRGRSRPQRQDAFNEDCPEDRERFRNVGESYDDSYSHSYHDRDRSRHIKRRRDNESSLSSVSKSDSSDEWTEPGTKGSRQNFPGDNTGGTDQSKRQTSEKSYDFRGYPTKGRGSSRFTPLTRKPKEILTAEAGKFQQPPPMVTVVEKRSSNKFCDFHNDKGHSTDELITSSVVPKEVGASLENFKVALHPDFPDQEVAIKGTLSTKRHTELCSLLKENLDIFVWQPSDTTGVPRSVAEHRLNIREGYSLFGYHQIQLAESDEEKTAFHTGQEVYCYTKMPFDLKNAGATYQRLVDKAFDSQIGQNIEVYVDDLVVKSHTEAEMLRDIGETFCTLRRINMKLNPKKSPKPKEELIVYMSASYRVISAVLMIERGAIQKLVYFVSRALQVLELNYTPMEKLVLSLIFTAIRLRRTTTKIERHARRTQYHVPAKDVDERTEKPIQGKEVTTVVEENRPTWMTLIMEYLKEGTLPSDRKEARKLRIKARQYELLEGVVYKRSFLTSWLRCVRPLQAKYVIREIHEGSCIMHAGPQYPQHPLTSITALWLFYKWGIDIAGPFPEEPAVIPAEIRMPTYRIAVVDVVCNDEELRLNLDLLKGLRECATIREAKAKLKMTKYNNARVHGVTFRPGDFVYHSNDPSHVVEGRKLGPKWEGPYEVTKALGDGAYKLRSTDGTVLQRT
nr:reverse transcriptase domain-containing protein [Tanacetum cinerariifolium]